jgi:PAS domain S-box-containing protein
MASWADRGPAADRGPVKGVEGTTGHPGTLERRLPPQPASVGEARRMIRGLLAGSDRDDLVETAVLLVSEVVTNALLHAGTPIDVAARLDDDGLRVEVGDGSLHLPVRRRYATTAGTGRGLLMLEQLVDDWGVSQHQRGKTVWFRLDTVDDGAGAAVAGQSESDRRPDGAATVDVELRNVPLLLHAAWQEHAEALLREFLLASLEDEADADPIQMHAEATDAIAILEEHIPRMDVDVEPDRLMEGATEPFVSVARLVVPVPVRSVPHFRTLDRTIEASLDLARRGITFTPPTQPEIQVFRRWLCRQVVDQAEGRPAVPWSVEGEPPPQPRFDLDWDPATVTAATTGRIAADEANRILAVSGPVLELLGYDDPAQLVGRRLVAIIPERFRQAHVAGFTMFLLTGRRPLLGVQVTVPALRRDGSEVLVNLEIESLSGGAGQTLLLAEMSPHDA